MWYDVGPQLHLVMKNELCAIPLVAPQNAHITFAIEMLIVRTPHLVDEPMRAHRQLVKSGVEAVL